MRLDDYIEMNRYWGTRIEQVGDQYFKLTRPGKSPFLMASSFPREERVDADHELVRKLRWRYLISPLYLESDRRDLKEYVLEVSGYDMQEKDKRIRQSIRKSLQNCSFRRPELSELIGDGLRINRQTLSLQSRDDRNMSDPELWERYITSIYESKDFRILGAFFQGRMVGYLIVFEIEGEFRMQAAFIDREDASLTKPMYGLLHTMVNELLSEHSRIRLSYGMHLYHGKQSLNRFKEKMGFRAIPVSKAYVIHPLVLALLKAAFYGYFNILGKKKAGNRIIRQLIPLYQGHRLLMKELYLKEIRNQVYRPDFATPSLTSLIFSK